MAPTGWQRLRVFFDFAYRVFARNRLGSRDVAVQRKAVMWRSQVESESGEVMFGLFQEIRQDGERDQHRERAVGLQRSGDFCERTRSSSRRSVSRRAVGFRCWATVPRKGLGVSVSPSSF